MERQFEKGYVAHATTESKVTLTKYESEHTFLLPEGKTQLFSWHTRYTGSYGGRIFFYPVPGKKKIYIGHIGHKLPTVKYTH